MKRVIYTVFIVIFALTLVGYRSAVWAQEVRPNNIFGIHLAVPSREDEASAARLVNSNGGRWGYVTVVIQENDRDVQKWRDTFDSLRRLHLIPIVRLATNPVGSYWRRPHEDDAQEWAAFLQQLPWVVEDRYIILFNEPNHAGEWGGAVDPAEYAQVAEAFTKALHGADSAYVVMLAGLDVAAPSQAPTYEDAAIFFEKMHEAQPKLFSQVDALSSHAYPNPAFAASPLKTGRNSIKTYEWELEVFREYGARADLPVFITETGWSRERLDASTVAQHTKTAFELWQQDDRVRAATPFILNYQSPPFTNFSWQKQGSNEFFEQYHLVQSMSKPAGDPRQKEAGSMGDTLAQELFISSTYQFHIELRNTGQAVWDVSDGYNLVLVDKESKLPVPGYFFENVRGVEPGQMSSFSLFMKTADQPSKRAWRVELRKNDRAVIGRDWSVEVLPLPLMKVRVGLFPRIRAKADREFEVQIFDQEERLVYKQDGLKRSNSVVTIDQVPNVYVGGEYRVVLLSRQYLPRQTHVTIQDGENTASMHPMLPLDFDEDGALGWGDLWALITHPWYVGYFLP